MKILFYKICAITVIGAACLVKAPAVLANTITAASPSYSHVSAAVSSAVPGDVVVIPAGTATWSSTLSYAKGIHLRGAGVGQTVITHSGVGIRVAGKEGAQFTIAGLEMVTTSGNACIETVGSCKNFVIQDCRFRSSANVMTIILSFGEANDRLDHQYGVVANCDIVNGRVLVSAGMGEGSWKEPTNLGSDNAVYVEDCRFTYPNGVLHNAIDSNYGSRYVFRHNYVEDASVMSHSLQNGWADYFGRGSRLVEIYENTFKAVRPNYTHWAAMFIRGGTGVIFNNEVINAGGDPFQVAVAIDNVRTAVSMGGLLGKADGSNPIDGNELPNGYPALDQIGRGRDSGPVGDSLPRYNATNRTPQALEPMYIWNNKLAGVVEKPLVHNNCGIHIEENRDFFTTPKPGYTPYPYPHPLRNPEAHPTMTVTSPNGGESWAVGTVRAITWATTGTVGNVKIEYSTNGGAGYATITSSTTNDGSHSWTVPNTLSSSCLVRVSEAATGTPSDVSNAAFAISAASGSVITVTSPNGGESWAVGTVRAITWVTTGTVGNVKIEYSTNGGAGYATITSSTTNDGSHSWTVPNTPSTSCHVRISEAATGTPSDVSNAAFAISATSAALITLNRAALNFGAMPGFKTSSQKIYISLSGGGSMSWTASSNRSWLTVTPSSGSGNAWITISVNPYSYMSSGVYTGVVSVADSAGLALPQRVTSTLRVNNTGTNPFGSFDVPADGAAGLAGSIPISGWALDDIEVSGVKIYRHALPGEPGYPSESIFIGDAMFIEGARPDVESAFPSSPWNYRAGWGYMILTNMLPNQGNGTFAITAIMTDKEGRRLSLGTKIISCDNALSTMPFGTIDTPAQGGIAIGNPLVNFGWALTPLPAMIPFDGSTISVFVDGLNLGHPSYNHYRQDIAGLFPGLANSLGAIGVFSIDTSGLTDGLHNIAWGVSDSLGNASGIGSRYFTVQSVASQASAPEPAVPLTDRLSIGDHPEAAKAVSSILMKRGFIRNEEWLDPGPDGDYDVALVLGEPLQLELIPNEGGDDASISFTGFQHVGADIRHLPVGSSLDARGGVFSWLPGAGFSGSFHLEFIQKYSSGAVRRWKVKATIVPASGRTQTSKTEDGFRMNKIPD